VPIQRTSEACIYARDIEERALSYDYVEADLAALRFQYAGEIMGFTTTQVSRVRQGLNHYRLHAGADGKALSWAQVQDDLLVSPVTVELRSGIGRTGLSAEALKHFATGQSVFLTSTIAGIKAFLVHEKILDEAEFSESPGAPETLLARG
jgi:hypothetical protein